MTFPNFIQNILVRGTICQIQLPSFNHFRRESISKILRDYLVLVAHCITTPSARPGQLNMAMIKWKIETTMLFPT